MEAQAPRANPAMGLLSIFYSPAEAYANSGQRGWMLALAAACLVAVLGNWFIINKIGYGMIVRNQLESMPSMAERLGPAGIDKAVRDAEAGPGKIFAYVGPAIAIPVITFVVAGLALGIFLVLGSQTTYWDVVTAGVWASYALLVVTMAGSAAAVAAMTDFTGVNVQQVFGLNAGMFLADAKPAVRALASGIDLLAFWAIFLQVTGITKISQRVSIGQALTVYITIHVLFVMVRAGWAAMFG